MKTDYTRNSILGRAGRFLMWAIIPLAGALPVAAHVGTAPLSLERKVLPVADLRRITLPSTDVNAELAADAKSAVRVPLRFAVPQSVELTPATSGTWEQMPDGRLWRLRVVSTNATDLNFGFTQFWLPEGATLYVVSEGENYYQGPYTAADNTAAGELWTPVVPGESAIIELYVPAGVKEEPRLLLSQVGAGYRDLFHRKQTLNGPKAAQACEIDVVCPQGTAWTNEIRSVARYSIRGMFLCSGTLVTDTAGDFRPFFLTANHCTLDSASAPTVVVYWNYQSPTCGQHGGGSLSQNQSGATFRASKYDVDFSLVELNTIPDSSYRVYYSGWDRSGTALAGCVGIHHPGGYEKCISLSSNSLTTVNSCIGTGGSSTHWQVTWSLGVTEQGSSGSGIWDPTTHRLIGTLSGGGSDCTAPTSPDCYGKFSVAWASGTSSADRLRDWLDPQTTGVTSLPGADPLLTSVVAPNGSALTSEGCSPANSVIDAGETVTVSFTLKNFGGVSTTNLVATLLATSGVLSPSAPQNYGAITSGGSATRSFTFTASGVCGTTITPTLQLQDGSRNLGPAAFNFVLGTAIATNSTVIFSQSFDGVTAPALPSGWTASPSGSWVTTAAQRDTLPNSVFATDPATISDYLLTSPVIPITNANSQLSFRHYYLTEASYDGGVLEISINGGAFSDILKGGGSFAANGYNVNYIPYDYGNPLGDRPAWSGNSGGFVTTSVNLAPVTAGQNIQLRWRLGSDNSGASTGWYVDTVSITAGNYGCCGAGAAGTLTVTPLAGLAPSGAVGGPFSPSSQVYTLSNSGNATLVWNAAKSSNWVGLSATNGSLAMGASTNVTVSVGSYANSLSSGAYADTVTFANTTTGLGNTSRAVSLTVKPTAFAVSGGGAYCSGGAGVSVSVSGSETGVNYYLKRSGTTTVTSTSGTGSAITFNSLTVAGTYTIVATNASAPSSWASMTGSAVVAVNARPTSLVSGTATTCNGNSTTIAAALTGTGPWNVGWSDGVNQNGVVASPATRTVSPSAITTYTVASLTDANCTAQAGDRTGSAVVTIKARPTSVVSGNTAICNGGSTTISAALAGTGPWNVSWSDGINQNGVVASPATRSVSPSATTTYTVISLTDANCTAQAGDRTGSAVVTVNSRPTSVASGNATICNGGSATISATLTGTGPWNVNWSDGINQNGVVSSPATRSVSPSATTTYTVTSLTDANCTAQTGDRTGNAVVTVNSRPTSVVSGSTAICNGSSTVIAAALTGTGPWNVGWSDGVSQNGVVASPATRTVSPSGTTTYTVTSLTDANCTAQAGDRSGSAAITVTSLPLAAFSGSRTNGGVPLTVTFTNLSSGASSYLWDFGDGHTNTNANPTYIYTASGSNTVSLTAIGPCGTNMLALTNYIVVTNTPALLVVSPANGILDTVIVGQSSTKAFQVVNAGGLPLTGSATTAPPFSVVSGSPFTVPVGQTGVVQVAFSPTQAGTFTTNLLFTSNGGNATNALTGTAVTPGSIVVSPASTNFGVVLVGTNASALFVVTNTGGGPISNGVASAGAPFSIASGGSFGLPGFGSTNVVVRFTPAGDGTFSTNVIFISSGGNSTNLVSGMGQTPGQIAVTPTNWDFGWVAVSNTADRTFVVTNRGGAPVTGGAVSVSPPFSVVSGSNFTVPGFGTSNVVVRFAPTNVAVFSTNLVFSSANGDTVTNLVSGRGALMPVASFTANRTSGLAPLTVMFTDTSTGTITNWTWAFGDGVTNSLTTNVVSHTYTAASTNTVSLTVAGPLGSSNATYVNYIIVTNLPPLLSVSPTNGPFGQLLVSQSSTQNFQIFNLGGQSLTGSVVTVPPFLIASASNTFSVPPGLTGLVQVAFSPTNAGSFTNNMVFTSNGGNQTNLLSGTAVTPGNIVVSPASTNFGVVLVGINATATLVVSNTGGGLVSNGVASVGTGPFSIISGTNFSLAGFGSTNVAVRFTPPGDGTFSNNVIFTSSGGNRTNSMSGVGQTPGQIAVSPASWDLGVVAVGANADRTFVVTNLGGAAVTGGSATASAPFSIVSGSSFMVAGFGTTNVVVRFTPTSAGSISNIVRFTTANGGNVTNAVRGTGLMPAQLVVVPASYNFGSVGTGTTAQVVFSVTNAGGAALSGSASVVAPFAILSGNPFDLPGHGTTNLAVSFTPATAASFTNDLIFVSNGGASTNRLTGAGVSAQGASFAQLGFPGYEVMDVSPDGTVVTGYAWDTNGFHYLPFEWTRPHGWQNVGNFDGLLSVDDSTGAWATDVSWNGDCIVGVFEYGIGHEPWTFAAYANGDFLVISNSGWGYQSLVSRDGTSFIAYMTVNNVEAAYLVSNRTNMQFLVPANFGGSDASTFLVGASSNLDMLLFSSTYSASSGSFRRAYVWRSDTGVVNIGNDQTSPNAISGDGKFVVGDNASGAFRWSQQQGFLQLGNFSAVAVSDDGTIVVGNGIAQTEPVLWKSECGVIRLRDLLSNWGISIAGWTNLSLVDMSADGTVFVGSGTNPQGTSDAWLATIPASFFPTLQAGFRASPTIGVAPLAVTFTDTSTGVITNRFWNFGDGTTTNTTATSLAHTYNATGSYNVQLIVSGPSGASTNSQYALILVGNPPQLTVNPASLGYGTLVVGQSSNQNIQVINTGDLPLTGTVTLATAGTPFTLSTGNLNVPGHQTNTVTLTFSPLAAGNFSNQVVFLSNGGNATNTVNGTAITPAQIAVSPASTNFGTVVLGSYAERTLVVTNAGGAPLSNGVATVATPFSIMSGGAFSLPGYGSTNVVVRFTPAAAGTFSSNVVFTTANAGGSTNAVTGTGVTPAQIVVTPASTNLGIVLVGTNASATFLVTNAGGAPLSNGVATVGTPFSIMSGGAFSLAGFGATNVVVRFTPAGDGTVTTNVIFISSGGNSTNSVTGVGQTPGQIAVTPTNWDYGWVAVGSNAQQTFVVTNRGGAQVIGGSVSVSPPFSVVSGSNFTVVGFGTTNVVVRFAPSGEVASITNVVFSSSNGGSVTNSVSGKGAIIAQPLFSADWTNGAVPLTVTFTDTSAGTITNRNWNFGDGSPVTNTAATTISHVYNVAGTNTVALVLTGPVGSRTNSKPGYIVVTNVPPMIASPPQTTTNFVGTTATFSVSATGTAPLAYQWRLYGTNLASQTSATLSRVNVQTNDAGPYTVVVTNVAGSLTSQVATLTVLVPPTIASQPQSATNVLGTTASFSVTASGTTPFAYQWRFYGTNLVGQTSATLSRVNVQTNDAGPYTVVVTNVAGSLTSQVATLAVLVPPTIASQPQSATNVLGTTASFSVAASGTSPLAYQWRFYGTNLSGQTSATLLRVNVQTNDAGPYTVVVTNMAGGLTSQVATLTVLVPPTIASQPQSRTNMLGTTASFSVTAFGTAPLAYQWRFNGLEIAGATATNLTLSNVQLTNAGSYVVVVRNVAGVVTSAVAVFTVSPFGSLDHFTWDGIPSPQRVNQAFPVRIAARDSLNNTVSNFSGTASLSGTDGPYTMFSGSGLFPVSFSSTTVGNYFTPNVDLLVTHVVHYGGSQVSLWMADGTLLASEAVSNPSGWMTTALNTPLELQAGQEYCVSCYSSTNYVTPGFSAFTHGRMGYSRLASGDTFPDGEPLLTQYWVAIRYTVPISITPPVSGAFSGGSWDGNITVTQACAALTLTADDGGGHGGTSGTISVLPLLPQPAFTAAPTNGLAPLRTYFTNLTTGATSYTWQFGNGQTSSLPSPACTYSNAGSYTVKLTAVGAGGTNSLSRTNFIVVTNPPPVIGVTPASYDFLVVAIGTTAQTTFVVTNAGGMTLHGTAVVAPPFAIVSGSNYTVAAYSAANVVVSFTPPAEYGFAGRVIFSSDGGISTNYVTGAGLAAVMPVASFTANPTSGCAPLTVTFTDTSTGTITNRFWDFGDGTTGNVATSLITHAYNVSGTNAVTLIVSGPLGTSTNRKSSCIVVTNLPPLTLAEALDTPGWTWTTGGDASWFTERTVTHDGVDAAQSGAITDSQASWLETTVAGPGTLTFWWRVSSEQDFDYLEFYVNGSQRAFISGEVAWQQKSITLGSGTNTLRWRYWKDDVSSAGQDRGWVDEVSFAPSFPSITAQPQSQTVIQGAAAGFSMTAAGAEPLQYQWWFNGVALSGATSSSYSILAASTNNAGNYLVVVTNDSGSVTSAVASLTVFVPPSIVTQPQSQMIPPGSNVTFTVLAVGTDPLSYQWRANGTNIAGATSTTFNLLSVSTNDAGGYVVVVTNWAGSVTSAVATLQVRELLQFQTTGGVMGIVNGSFRVRLIGMSQTSAVVIEASTNHPNRFYRAVEVP